MNFDFDDTQYALRDLARDLFAKESPPSRLRGLWEGKPFDRGTWKTMADAGLCGLTVPEAYGGAGSNEIDLTLVYEEGGRAALPEPLLETTGIAAPLIAEAGSDELRDRWLPAIAAGEAVVAVRGPSDEYVTWAAEADLLITSEGGSVHAVPRERFAVKPVRPLDPSRPVAVVDADTGDDTFLCSSEQAWDRAGWRASFGTACLLNGLASHLLEATVSYTVDRKQFGRPVGSFQAIKHKLASMHVAIESSRPAAWYAGYAIATGSGDAAEASSVAIVASSSTGSLCDGEALQCHGGIGFTWEHDLHMWLKRGIALRATYGTAAAHRRRLASVWIQALGEKR